MTVENGVEPAPLTVDALHAELRSQILSGELPPGAVLSQVKLAGSFGTGRTPLREALRMLQREGLVDAEYNRRVRVAPLSTSELDQIYASRVVIEAMAVRVTVMRMNEVEIARLADLQATMQSYMPDPRDRLEDWEEAHSAFHLLLIGGVGDRVTETASQLQDHALRYRRLMGRTVPNLFAPGAGEHAELVAATQRRDPDEASSVLATHLARAGLALLAQVNPTYDAVALRQALRLVIRDRVSDTLPV